MAEKQAESHADGSGTGGESEEPDSEDGDADPQPQTETATEAVTEPVEETMEETETGLPEGTEVLPEDALDAALEETEDQKTVDEESGLTLGEVLLQAEDQGIDIQGLENGESVTFTAQAPMAQAPGRHSLSPLPREAIITMQTMGLALM